MAAYSTSASNAPINGQQQVEAGFLKASQIFFRGGSVSRDDIFGARVLHTEKIVLPTFKADEQALFGKLLNRTDIPIKLVGEIDLPEEELAPALLMHDLENQSHKTTAVYKHISKASQENQGSALYGTSGIGKT